MEKWKVMITMLVSVVFAGYAAADALVYEDFESYTVGGEGSDVEGDLWWNWQNLWQWSGEEGNPFLLGYVDSAVKYEGNKSMRLDAPLKDHNDSGYFNSDEDWGVQIRDDYSTMDVSAYNVMTAMVRAGTDSSITGCSIKVRDASYADIGVSDSVSVPNDGNWHKIIVVLDGSGNKATMELVLPFFTIVSNSTGSQLWIDDIRFDNMLLVDDILEVDGDYGTAGETVEYSFVMTEQPPADVNFTLTPPATLDFGAGLGVSVHVVFTALNWNVAQEITVSISSLADGDQTVTTFASSTDPDYNAAVPGSFSIPVFGQGESHVVYTATPAANYTAPDDGGELVNGTALVGYIYDDDWSSYYVPDGNLVINFNLNESVELSSIKLFYMVYDGWSVYAPISVTYSFSTDGINFGNSVTITGLDNSNWEHTVAANIPGGITTRYVRAELAPDVGDWMRLSEFTFVKRGEISYTTNVEPVWFTPDLSNNLANGILPTDPYDADWLEYQATKTLEINLNLNNTVTLSGVGICYYVLDLWSYQSPDNVELTFSTDGVNFGNAVIWSAFDANDGAHTLKISVPDVTCQYIKAVLTAPAASVGHRLGEFLFYDSSIDYNSVPTAVAAGLMTFDNPYDILVVFDHPVDAVSAGNLDNYKMDDNLIASAEVWSKSSNCVKISVTTPLVSGSSYILEYRNIEGLAGDNITYWRQTNSFGPTSIAEEAKKILVKQLPDGAYNMVAPLNGVSFEDGDNNIWIAPSFDHLAAQAMLMANEVSPDPNYLLSVESYLHWHVNHLNANGTIYDYTGTYPDYTSSGDYDSTDAYAAQFIETAYMYYQVTEDSVFLDWVWPYIIQIAGTMDLTLQSDGLTWAKPDYNVKYLMDNTDVYIGYKAAAKFAALKSDTVRQLEWSTKAANNLAGLETMYLGDITGRYANAKDANGTLDMSWTNAYPEGGAQMSAIRNILMETNPERSKILWETTTQQFIPDGVPAEDITAWWVLGGVGVGKGDSAETFISFVAYQKYSTSWSDYIIPDYSNITIMHQRFVQQQNGDYNIDGRIDFKDFAVLAEQWDGSSLDELADLADNWLKLDIWWD